MSYKKIYNVPDHMRSLYKELNRNSRTKRRYVATLNPGRNFERSVPFVYVLKYFNLNVKLNQTYTQIANKKLIKVNNNYVRDLKFPVSSLDVVEVLENNAFTKYVFYIRKEKSSYKMLLQKFEKQSYVYPVIGYRRRKDHYEINTFQNKKFKVPLECITELKKFGSYVRLNFETKDLVCSSLQSSHIEHFDLIKLTGKQKMCYFDVLKLTKEDQYYYKLDVKRHQQQKTKSIVTTRKSFFEKYTFCEKLSLEPQ